MVLSEETLGPCGLCAGEAAAVMGAFRHEWETVRRVVWARQGLASAQLDQGVGDMPHNPGGTKHTLPRLADSQRMTCSLRGSLVVVLPLPSLQPSRPRMHTALAVSGAHHRRSSPRQPPEAGTLTARVSPKQRRLKRVPTGLANE